MQFALICRDAPDALERRLAVRAEHLDGVHRLKRESTILDGGAILDDDGRMIGSVVLCEFPNRAALDVWLLTEPFMCEGVWEHVEVLRFRRVDWEQSAARNAS